MYYMKQIRVSYIVYEIFFEHAKDVRRFDFANTVHVFINTFDLYSCYIPRNVSHLVNEYVKIFISFSLSFFFFFFEKEKNIINYTLNKIIACFCLVIISMLPPFVG